jgi:hypothetical protein
MALVTNIPREKAAVSVDETAEDLTIGFTPSNPRAAPVKVHAEIGGDAIYVVAGEDTNVEITLPESDAESRPDLEKAVREARALCEAVVLGRFRERLWTKHDAVVRSEGSFDLEEGRVEIVSRHLGGGLLRGAETRERHYAAYAE